MITLIIPCYKNPEYLRLCLHSATQGRVHDQDGTKIIVVLDGFIDMFTEVINEFKPFDVQFYGFTENRGMQSALNYGVSLAETEFVLIANDDNVFPDRWDARLGDYCEKNVVVTINQIEPPPVDGGFNMFNFVWKNFGRTVAEFDSAAFQEFETSISAGKMLPTGCIFPFLMTKARYLAAGGFDTLYDSPNICDWDFFLKLQLSKVMFTRIHSVHFYHFGSVITRKSPEAEMFSYKQRIASGTFKNKWGFEPVNQPGYNIKFPPNTEFINGIKLPKPKIREHYLDWE